MGDGGSRTYRERQVDTINEDFDKMVMEMWQQGRIQEFLEMLPQYARDCSGEGGMHDTAMLFGLLGWESYNGKGEVYTEYFPSSGTGQCNVVFPVGRASGDAPTKCQYKL